MERAGLFIVPNCSTMWAGRAVQGCEEFKRNLGSDIPEFKMLPYLGVC